MVEVVWEEEGWMVKKVEMVEGERSVKELSVRVVICPF